MTGGERSSRRGIFAFPQSLTFHPHSWCTVLRPLNTLREWRRVLDTVGEKALPTLSRCLGGPVLRELGLTGQSAYLRAALVETGCVRAIESSATLAHLFRSIFDLLKNAYRCDYVYRTAITRMFLRRYSPTTTTLLSELRVWRSKADLAMFNGTSVAFEIKTELDNVDRLDSQLRDYSSMFDRIFVATHERRLAALRRDLPDHVGILVLGRGLSLRVERDAVSNADQVRTATVVDALRREEVVAMTRRLTGSVPSATHVGLIDECARALAPCPPRAVHDAMVAVLKQRVRLTRADLVEIAPELVAAYMETGLSTKLWPQITSLLTRTTIGDLIDGHGKVLPVLTSQDL